MFNGGVFHGSAHQGSRLECLASRPKTLAQSLQGVKDVVFFRESVPGWGKAFRIGWSRTWAGTEKFLLHFATLARQAECPQSKVRGWGLTGLLLVNRELGTDRIPYMYSHPLFISHQPEISLGFVGKAVYHKWNPVGLQGLLQQAS